MPGHRAILGRDVHAALRSFGPPDADADALEAWVGEDDRFLTLDELLAACPPERVGLSEGAYLWLFAPLFGEFE
jgi:hypothetical protein